MNFHLINVALLLLLAGQATAQTPTEATPSSPYPAAEKPAEENSEQTTPQTATDPYEDRLTTEAAKQAALWNSPEMLEAREYVVEYSRRSARTSTQQVERYLHQVSQLPSSAMQHWLQQLQARRAANEGQQKVAEAARQMSLEQARQRIEQSRQAGFNAQQMKMAMAEFFELQKVEQAAADAASIDRKAELAAAVAAQRLVFDPFAPTLDPASPDAYTRYAAAAALPGDLPRGDPANFSRGDDRGGGSGVPSTGGAAPGPAAPAGDGGGGGTGGTGE